MKILIAYDGTVQAKKAMSYGLNKAREKNAEVLVVQVFDPRIFIDYDAGPRAEELGRADAMRMHQEGKKLLEELGSGVVSRMVFEEGDSAAIIDRYAAGEQADLVLVPAKLKAAVKDLSHPVIMIPGTVLVPVDNTETAYLNRAAIIAEAQSTGSRVHLAGIVPIHLYSRDEKQELEQVRTETLNALRRLGASLEEQKIATTEEMRFGYPDEEILRSAEAQGASLILLPAGGTTPSELSKAAMIILEEPVPIKWPVVLLPSTEVA